jgi:predicted small lipoprotein YifL
MGIATRMMAAATCLAALAGCGGDGRFFPDLQVHSPVQVASEPAPPAIREPVLPEMLVNCGGNVLVPALGMTLVMRGQTPPEKGLYLREERLNAPYRILPPGSHPSAELSPKRLNIETDKSNRIIGLYCG